MGLKGSVAYNGFVNVINIRPQGSSPCRLELEFDLYLNCCLNLNNSSDENETRLSDLIQAQTCHVKGSFISNTSERAILELLMNVYFSVSINICKILHLYNRYWHSYSGNGVPKTADTKWSNFGEHSAISHKCTDLYFSVWPFNHWQQSISARWLDAYVLIYVRLLWIPSDSQDILSI